LTERSVVDPGVNAGGCFHLLKDDSVVVLAYGESDAAISTCDDPPK
jgi:hypothetical protein